MKFDLNLASYKYDVLLKNENIISRIIISEEEILPNVRGYQAQTFLNVDFNNSKPTYRFHSNADGTGSDIVEKIAIYKSISESLERWAYTDLKSKNLVVNSSGFAAFPGLLGNKARELSLLEALERWSLHKFNQRQLLMEHKCISDDIDLYFSYISKYATYFVITTMCKKNSRYYGFGSGKTLFKAKNAAEKELMRNKRTLENIQIKYEDVDNLQEKRLLYFSVKEGQDYFYDLIKYALSNQVEMPPNIIEQKKVIGRWSKFTDVWYTRFDNDCYLNEELNYFYF